MLVSLNSNKFVLITGLLLTLLLALLHELKPSLLESIDYELYDTLLGSSQQFPPSGKIIIVDIDDDSLSQYGQWPWPRYRIAKLLDTIKNRNALMVGVDFVFAEPDQTSLQNISIAMKKEITEDFSFPIINQNIPKRYFDNDRILAQTLVNGPFVLGYSFIFDSNYGNNKKINQKYKLHSANVVKIHDMERLDERSFLKRPSSVVANIAPLANNIKSSGFFDIFPDNDGIVRRVPLLMIYENEIYPNLSLAILKEALKAQQIVYKVSHSGAESIKINDKLIPVDAHGNMMIRFSNLKESRFEYVSAASILSGSVNNKIFDNKIVMLGTSAKGLNDYVSTPFKSIFNGVEVHATIIENIISQNIISRPAWVHSIEFLLIIFIGTLYSFLLVSFRAIWNLLSLLCGVTLLWNASAGCFNLQIYFSPLYPILILLINFSMLSAMKYWQEERKVVFQTKKMNSIQEGIIQMLRDSNVKLEENSNSQEQTIEEKASELENAFNLIEKANTQIKDSLNYGARIQKSLLPSQEELLQSIKNGFVIWEPRDTVSGDIYFNIPLSNGFIVAVIDCTGHGIPGALLTMIASSSLRKITTVENCHDPATILSKLNTAIKSTLRQDTKYALSNDGLEISLCRVNTKDNELIFSAARHSLFYIENNVIHHIKGDRQLIGYKQSKKTDIHFRFNTTIIPIKQSMVVYLFSDGFVDQKGGEKNFPFGNKRFKNLLLEIHQLPFERQKEHLQHIFHEYKARNTRLDDVTIMGFTVEHTRQ